VDQSSPIGCRRISYPRGPLLTPELPLTSSYAPTRPVISRALR
jgi:hypothetical protein